MSIYNEADKTSTENGDIYAWQKPGWLKMGNIGNIYELKAKIEEEAAARADVDAELQRKMTAEATARESADAEIRTLAEGIVGSIDVAKIDAVPGSVAEAVRMTKDTLHSRWTLVSDGKNVGVVDMFSDSMRHQLTEVLTTHYSMNTEGKLDFGVHNDKAIYRYFRSYNINSAHLENEKGTWTEWAEDISDTVKKSIAGLSGLIDKENKARTEAETALAEDIADNTNAITEEKNKSCGCEGTEEGTLRKLRDGTGKMGDQTVYGNDNGELGGDCKLERLRWWWQGEECDTEWCGERG